MFSTSFVVSFLSIWSSLAPCSDFIGLVFVDGRRLAVDDTADWKRFAGVVRQMDLTAA